MKINPISLAAISMMFCCLNSAARADEDADRAALRAIKARYEQGANSGDLSKMADDVSKDITGVMVTGEPVKGFDGLVDYWKGIQNLIGPGGSYHVTVNVDKTDFFGDVAVSRGTTDEKVMLPGGKELDFSAYWTSVCHKEDGVWKVFRIEATMNPVHNIFVSYQLARVKWVYGAAGFAAGIVAVLLLRLLLRKRKT